MLLHTVLVLCVAVGLVKCQGELTDDEKTLLLNLHNQKRTLEVGASNMMKLKWDDDLAAASQAWADGCNMLHDTNVRENMAFTFDVTVVFMMWYNEKYDYDNALETCAEGRVCGHYENIMNANSNLLGCGRRTECDGQISFVCRFSGSGPSGVGPYKKGPACSDCRTGNGWCDDGLCNGECSAAGDGCECNLVCENGATLEAATCTCSCADDWNGNTCNETCTDTFDGWFECNPSSGSGYQFSSCGDGHVRNVCPQMCGECKISCDMTAESCNIPHSTGFDDVYCRCKCEASWGGDNCDVCGKQCPTGVAPYGNYCEQCACPIGTMGDDCTETCQDLLGNCGSGYNPAGCATNWYTRKMCPLMCGVCTVACDTPPVCDHGTVNTQYCRCDCEKNWSGELCDTCGLECGEGTAKTDCSACVCPAGKMGNGCTATCQDFRTDCNPGSGSGVYPNHCGVYWWADAGCPLMCGLCTVACDTPPVCDHGTVNTQYCKCDCEHNWSGELCDTCGLECGEGTAKTDCSACVCPAGKMGNGCTATCENLRTDCHPASGSGVYPNHCGVYWWANAGCPLMCGDCTAA